MRMSVSGIRGTSVIRFSVKDTMRMVIGGGGNDIHRIAVHPLDGNVRCGRVRGTVLFALRGPRCLSVRFSNSQLRGLRLFTGPLRARGCSGRAGNVVCFNPKIRHPGSLPGGRVHVPNGAAICLTPKTMIGTGLLMSGTRGIQVVKQNVLSRPVQNVRIASSGGILVSKVAMIGPSRCAMFKNNSAKVAVGGLGSFDYGN